MCMMHNRTGAAGSAADGAAAHGTAGEPLREPEKPLAMGLGRKVYSVHNHVGRLEPWPFYESEEPISPADPGPETAGELDFFMKCRGIEKTLIIPNYGIPVQEQPFGHNELVAELAERGGGKVAGALWMSGLPRNRALTEAALAMLDRPNIAAIKMSYLLGGTADPGKWDEPTLRQHEAIFRAAIERDIPIHFHTSPGGGSDITGFFEIIRRWGKELRIHLVHMGGGVSGHIRLLSQWQDLVQSGYKVYLDTSWAIGFAVRKLLQELDRTGIGVDRVMFGCDEPWSDFESEFWKIQGARVSEEIKERIFWGNAEAEYFSKLA